MISRCLTCFLLLLGFGLQLQSDPPAMSDREKDIVQQLKGLRSISDQHRADSTKQIALAIRQLPADTMKVRLASGLASLSTEGDFGRDTLQAVADTLSQALREQPAQAEQAYTELAQLVRYEHVQVTLESPQLTAAQSKLETEDRDRQHANFTLEDVKGKEWTLQELHGQVVLVNFWATWCPPCRKEMPDLDNLYRRFKKQGLVVLAISDEDHAKVKSFLYTRPVSYPVLLDDERKVNMQFHVEGIPKSFVYSRTGQLVAQAIDMRTEQQFLGMLRQAGLNTEQ